MAVVEAVDRVVLGLEDISRAANWRATLPTDVIVILVYYNGLSSSKCRGIENRTSGNGICLADDEVVKLNMRFRTPPPSVSRSASRDRENLVFLWNHIFGSF